MPAVVNQSRRSAGNRGALVAIVEDRNADPRLVLVAAIALLDRCSRARPPSQARPAP
jgi:hypothetical protein